MPGFTYKLYIMPLINEYIFILDVSVNDFLPGQVLDRIDKLTKNAMTGHFGNDGLTVDKIEQIGSLVIVHYHQKPIVIQINVVDCFSNVSMCHVKANVNFLM